MLKLAIFDLGNVLFEINFNKAVRYWADKSSETFEAIRSRVSEHLVYRKFERGEIEADEFFILLKEYFGLKTSIEEIINGWNSIFGPVYFENYKAMIEISKEAEIVALTNTNVTHNETWENLYKKELSIFNKIYKSTDLGMRKPEHRIFKYVLNDCGVSGEETVFFDDLINNTREAQAMGIDAVVVRKGNTVHEWLRKRLL